MSLLELLCVPGIFRRMTVWCGIGMGLSEMYCVIWRGLGNTRCGPSVGSGDGRRKTWVYKEALLPFAVFQNLSIQVPCSSPGFIIVLCKRNREKRIILSNLNKKAGIYVAD